MICSQGWLHGWWQSHYSVTMTIVQWACPLEVQSYCCHLLNTARRLHQVPQYCNTWRKHQKYVVTSLALTELQYTRTERDGLGDFWHMNDVNVYLGGQRCVKREPEVFCGAYFQVLVFWLSIKWKLQLPKTKHVWRKYVAIPDRNQTLFRCVFWAHHRAWRAIVLNFR